MAYLIDRIGGEQAQNNRHVNRHALRAHQIHNQTHEQRRQGSAVEKPWSLAVTASSVFNKPLPSCNSATLARIAPIGRIKVQIHTSLP